MDDNESAERMKIGDLERYSKEIDTIVKVVSKTEPRSVSSRRDMSSHQVCEALVGDETGSIYLTLWDDAIDGVEAGQVLSLKNAYIKLFRGSMRLNIGRLGSYELVESAPFEEVNLDNNLSDKQFEQSYRSTFGGRDRRYSRRRRY